MPTTLGNIKGLPPAYHKASFQKFLRESWEAPINASGDGDSLEWRDVMNLLSTTSGLGSEDFTHFRRCCHFDFQPDVQPRTPFDDEVERSHEADVEALKHHLLNLASADQAPGKIERTHLLEQLGWERRFRAAYPHEFRIDPRYQPIQTTVDALLEALAHFDSGYLALIGSPGSGKSTTLTHTLRQQGNHRLVRYYAFVPNETLFERGEALSFFHDVVLQLRQQGIRSHRGFISESLRDLQEEFSAQLHTLERNWQATGKKTVILIDGLDHVEREQNPIRSLLATLPLAESVPKGVILCLGSQTKNLRDLPHPVSDQLNEPGRTIEMSRLPRSAVNSYLASSIPDISFSVVQSEKVFALSEGHPLALALLVESLRKLNAQSDVDLVLADATQFQGTIEKTYANHWRRLSADEALISLLGYIARMRGVIDLRVLTDLVPDQTFATLRRSVTPYLSFANETQCRFFHNSFRQFILSQTSRNAFGKEDKEKHRKLHRDLATLSGRLPPNQPFAWESIYHSHCAADLDILLKTATASYFRAQARSVRHPRAIFNDLRLVVDAARRKNDPLASVAVALTFREISRRFRWQEDMALPTLLLRLRGPESCLHYIISNESLLVEPEEALRVCSELVNSGHTEAARRLFEISEPIAILERSETVEILSDNQPSILTAWAAVACEFRPALDVLNAILGAKIDRSRGFHQYGDTVLDHRRSCIEAALLHLVRFARWPQLDEALTFLKDHAVATTLKSAVNWAICTSSPSAPRAKASLLEIESSLPADTGVSERLELAALSWRIRRDQADLIGRLDQISPPERSRSSRLHEGSTFLRSWLLYSRLRSICGQPVNLSGLRKSDDDLGQQLNSHLVQAVTEIGILWGRGLAGINADSSAVRLLTESLIRFFDQDLSRSADHWEWNSIQREVPTLFGWLIHAVQLHGDQALTALSEVLDKRWIIPSPKWPWSFDHQRQVALMLFKADGNAASLTRRLAAIQVRPEGEEDPSSETAYQRDMVSAWLEADQCERAEDCFSQMLDAACGVQSGGEDDEPIFWVKWFANQVEVGDPHARDDISKLARALSLLITSGRGGVSDCLSLLAEAAETVDRRCCETLWSWWLDQGAATWTDAVRGILLSFIRRDEIPIEATIVGCQRLLVPWETDADEELPSALSSAVYRPSLFTRANVLLKPLIETVSTRAFSATKKVWFDAISRFAEFSGRLPPAFPRADFHEDKSPELPSSEKPTLRLANGTEVTWESAVETVHTADSAIALLKANSFSYRIREAHLVKVLFARLKQTDLQSFASNALLHVTDAKVLTAIANSLLDVGEAQLARPVAEQAVKSASTQGWVKQIDGGTAVAAGTALVKAAGTEGRNIVLQRWLRDIIAGEAGIPERFDDLQDIIELIFDTVPYSQLWPLLREHFLQFAEIRGKTHGMPALPSGSSLAAVGTTLVRWLAKGCELSLNELEDECFRGLCDVSAMGSSDEAIRQLLSTWLLGNDDCAARALAILRVTHRVRPDFVRTFSDIISKMGDTKSFLVRESAAKLASALGVIFSREPTDLHHSPIYDLSLPPIVDPEHRLPSDLYARGQVTPDSEDPWEWLSTIHDELRMLAKFSEIPLQNLMHRAAAVMQDCFPRSDWDSTSEKTLRDRLVRMELRMAYARPQANVARYALARIVAELVDAKRIENEFATALCSRLNRIDLVAVRHEPHLRPPEIKGPVEEDITTWQDEDWLKSTSNALPHCLDRLDDGRIVLAELSKFRRSSRECREEYRLSCWCAPSWRPHDDSAPVFRVFATNTWWRMDEYPFFAGLDNIHGVAVYFYPVFARVGGAEWLCAHSKLCHLLGWELSLDGTYRWESGGVVMVETIWWKDGPGRRIDVNNEEITAEGWLVVATPEAARQLSERFPSVVRKRVVRRIESHPDDDETPASSVESTTEIHV